VGAVGADPAWPLSALLSPLVQDEFFAFTL
jgi:hypothetical protein